ncbi:MAG: TetR/AcrR family transcriptional regulator [Acidobacteriota bacterium]
MRSTAKVADKKREILLAASRVFRAKGLHGAGMRDIAGELGMTVGNLYYYFENKHELLAFCQEDALDGLRALAARVRALPERSDTKLYRLIVGHVELLNESTPGSLAHLEVEALEGAFRTAALAGRDEYERAVQSLVEEGMAARLLRPCDAKVAAFALLGALNWTVKWFRPEGSKSASKIGEEFAELLVRGLLAPGIALAPPKYRITPNPAQETL